MTHEREKSCDLWSPHPHSQTFATSLKRQSLAFAITWNPALVPVYVKTTLNDTNVMMAIYIAERLYPASHQCSGGQLLQGVLVTIRLYMIVTMF